jgi:hypothetical protein
MTQHARAAIGAAALIGLGFALGVATDRWWLAHEAPAPTETQAEMRTRLLDDMQETVGLTQEQVTAVHEILSRHQGTVTRAWNDLQPRLTAALDSAFTEIYAVLDDDQIDLFRHWFAQTHQLTPAPRRP